MMKKDIVTTQVRLPKNIHEQLKQEAEELGVSFNAHLIEVAWLGIKVRNSDCLRIENNQQYQ